MIELGSPSPPKSPAGEEGQFELALIIEISLFV